MELVKHHPGSIRGRPLLRVALVGLSLFSGWVVTGCGGTTRHDSEQLAFLRRCDRSAGADALGDASVCLCTLTQLRAQTNRRSFRADVVAWEDNADGASYRSTVAVTIARCNGQQEMMGSSPIQVPAAPDRTLRPAKTVKLSAVAYKSRFRWPHDPQSMVHTCTDGTAVANGMSCLLGRAIAAAFGDYPKTTAPVARLLHVVDPDNGRVVSVACAISGQKNASAVCNAPRRQIALLAPPSYSS